jgi:hypothetical protein
MIKEISISKVHTIEMGIHTDLLIQINIIPLSPMLFIHLRQQDHWKKKQIIYFWNMLVCNKKYLFIIKSKFYQYLFSYYLGGIHSTYLWDKENGGIAGAFMIKKG